MCRTSLVATCFSSVQSPSSAVLVTSEPLHSVVTGCELIVSRLGSNKLGQLLR
jgi:hypothetical protein